MSPPVIIDAGPSLNFLATKNERTLFRVVGKGLMAPETVRYEVLAKSATDRRFRAAAGVWKKLEGSWIDVLSDDVTPELDGASQMVLGSALAPRMRAAKDLGEAMVIVHAVVLAESGLDVDVIIDDLDGRAMANQQRIRLDRVRAMGREVGRLALRGTEDILSAAVGSREVPDKVTMRKIYNQLRQCDDGLVHFDQTQLTSKNLWGQ